MRTLDPNQTHIWFLAPWGAPEWLCSLAFVNRDVAQEIADGHTKRDGLTRIVSDTRPVVVS